MRSASIRYSTCANKDTDLWLELALWLNGHRHLRTPEQIFRRDEHCKSVDEALQKQPSIEWLLKKCTHELRDDCCSSVYLSSVCHRWKHHNPSDPSQWERRYASINLSYKTQYKLWSIRVQRSSEYIVLLDFEKRWHRWRLDVTIVDPNCL